MPGKRTATESLVMLGFVKHAQMSKVPKPNYVQKGLGYKVPILMTN